MNAPQAPQHMPITMRQAMNEGEAKRRIHAALVAEHTLRVDNPLRPIQQQRWYCTCGKWEGTVPARGPFNTTSKKARLGVVTTAHGRHLKSAIAKATGA